LPETAAVMKSLGKYQLSSGMQFMLYVGGISPHKNLNALVSAFQRMLSDPLFENVKLVLVGDYNEDSFLSAYDSVRGQVAKSGLQDKVIFTGFVSDEDLAVLYNAATLLVLPSFEEGFGLPAIEAMACGTPVVCSNRGPMPELLGDAGRFFDPTDVQMMTDVLKSVFADEALRKRMRESALKRAPQFSWGNVATDTLRIFEEVSMQA